MRKIKLKNDKLKKILVDRGVLVEEGRKISTQKEDLDKELQKIGYKLNRLKDKTVPLMKKEEEGFGLSEFEIISRVFVENDEVIVEIADQVEEYKQMLRNKNEDNNNNSIDK